MNDEDLIITCTEVITNRVGLFAKEFPDVLDQGRSANIIRKNLPLKQLCYHYCTCNVFVSLGYGTFMLIDDFQ